MIDSKNAVTTISRSALEVPSHLGVRRSSRSVGPLLQTLPVGGQLLLALGVLDDVLGVSVEPLSFVTADPGRTVGRNDSVRVVPVGVCCTPSNKFVLALNVSAGGDVVGVTREPLAVVPFASEELAVEWSIRRSFVTHLQSQVERSLTSKALEVAAAAVASAFLVVVALTSAAEDLLADSNSASLAESELDCLTAN